MLTTFSKTQRVYNPRISDPGIRNKQTNTHTCKRKHTHTHTHTHTQTQTPEQQINRNQQLPLIALIDIHHSQHYQLPNKKVQTNRIEQDPYFHCI